MAEKIKKSGFISGGAKVQKAKTGGGYVVVQGHSGEILARAATREAASKKATEIRARNKTSTARSRKSRAKD